MPLTKPCEKCGGQRGLRSDLENGEVDDICLGCGFYHGAYCRQINSKAIVYVARGLPHPKKRPGLLIDVDGSEIRDWLTVDEAAVQLRVASLTVRRWIKSGRLFGEKRNGRQMVRLDLQPAA